VLVISIRKPTSLRLMELDMVTVEMTGVRY